MSLFIHMNRLIVCTAAMLTCFMAIVPNGRADDTAPNPGAFDFNGDGVLSVPELEAYVAKRDDLKLDSTLLLADDLTLKVGGVDAALHDLRERAGREVGAIYEGLSRAEEDRSPLPVDDVTRLEQSRHIRAKETKPLHLDGLFRSPSEVNGKSLGPLLLRKDINSIEKDVHEAEGAQFSYSNDRKAGGTSWQTEGALVYPITNAKGTASPIPKAGSTTKGDTTKLLPSISWRVNKSGKDGNGDIEELQLQVSYIRSINLGNGGWLRNTEVSAAPYLLSDFSLDGLVWGAMVKVTPYIKSTEGPEMLAINAGYISLGSAPLMYRFAAVPLLDFNHLSRTSRFITRDGKDTYLRGGLNTELGIRTRGFPAFETIVSYQGFESLAGASGYSDLASFSGKLWLNEFAAFTAKYQKGETPVAQKAVNLFTAGIELKF